MGKIDINLSEFDDPAPTPLNDAFGHSSAAGAAARTGSMGAIYERERVLASGLRRRPRKRKLPYRANLVVEGRRYKGQRVSRDDADLDVETLGIVDDEDDAEGELSATEDLEKSGEDSDSAVEYEGRNNMGGEDDADVGLMDDEDSEEEDDDAEEGEGTAADELETEERAVAARLAEAEEKERARASAVKKQKEFYDDVVNLRIRIESLVALARQFPSRDQRSSCGDWAEVDELKEAQERAESTLVSLVQRVEEAWVGSFPSGGEEASSSAFEIWRDSVLDTWGRKVNEASGMVPKGGFKSLETTVSAQLRASVATGKHLQRTRRVREGFPLIGKDLEMEQGSNQLHFDDGDLYRALLREIIETGQGEGGGLKYAQLSKSAKVKKRRERSLAKGKRLKYDVHEKLVGFLAPVPLPDPGPLDEIVAALFGKRGTVPAS